MESRNKDLHSLRIEKGKIEKGKFTPFPKVYEKFNPSTYFHSTFTGKPFVDYIRTSSYLDLI